VVCEGGVRQDAGLERASNEKGAGEAPFIVGRVSHYAARPPFARVTLNLIAAGCSGSAASAGAVAASVYRPNPDCAHSR
jgi:hypothetical protein